jgi:hypothetical protein
MLTLDGRDPGGGAGLTWGVLGVLVNVMICGSFGFDRWKGFREARGPQWCIAIGNWTRHYNICLHYRAASDFIFLFLGIAYRRHPWTDSCT